MSLALTELAPSPLVKVILSGTTISHVLARKTTEKLYFTDCAATEAQLVNNKQRLTINIDTFFVCIINPEYIQIK